MKKIASTLSIIVLAIQLISAQTIKNDSLFFTGAIMDSEQSKALPFASFHINKNRVGTADAIGRFSFQVNIGDTIRYSFLGYRDVQVIVDDSLKQKKYLTGIFMTKDTIALEEVIILPRFGNFKDAFLKANINTKEYVNATNNVNDATYQALTTAFSPNATMDAKDNTDMLLKEHAAKVEYKGMVSPDMMVGVSSDATFAGIKRFQRKRKLKIPNTIITDKEIEMLQRMCKISKK